MLGDDKASLGADYLASGRFGYGTEHSVTDETSRRLSVLRGPSYERSTGYLYVVNCQSDNIHRVYPDGKVEVFAKGTRQR